LEGLEGNLNTKQFDYVVGKLKKKEYRESGYLSGVERKWILDTYDTL
jgi:hypothetical protein